MESPLEVLSRAATMVQDTTNDTKLTTNKELPTTKWRRDRRLRTSPEYHATQSGQQKPPSQPTTPTSLPFTNCLRLSNSASDIDVAPLDMTLTVKPRSPPPPYRAPLPGSIYASCVNSSINRNNVSSNINTNSCSSNSDSVSPRPSVITQAPKRDAKGAKCEKESISMCDPVIDEHFRRSLGDNYMILFSKNGQLNKKQKPNETDDESRPSIEDLKVKTEVSSEHDDDGGEQRRDEDLDDNDDDGADDDGEEIDDEENNGGPRAPSSDLDDNDDDSMDDCDPHSQSSLSNPPIYNNGNGNNNCLSVSPTTGNGDGLGRTATLSPKTLNNSSNSNNSINSNNSSTNNSKNNNNNKQSTTTTTTISSDSIELSVDDHFAKALGETWKKLQETNSGNKKDSLRPCVN